MDFHQAIISGFKNYVNFRGRAARSEYWYWVLFSALTKFGVVLVNLFFLHLYFFVGRFPFNPLSVVLALALLLPSLAVAVRRLHDVDRRGWWLLIEFTIIGIFFPILYWKCIKGTAGPNRFGPDPLPPAVT